MHTVLKLLISLFLICFSFNALANETIDGKKLFQEKCSECHQKDGNSENEEIPNIAGFSSILVFDILDQFKSGDRTAKPIKIKNNVNGTKDVVETDMNQIAKKLNTNEIEAISFFLANQTSKPTSQKYDKNLANKGKEIHMDLCENCHVDHGTGNVEDASILKGQWKNYLQSQFEALSEDKRYMPKRMKKRFRKLSEEDKKALIEFYMSPVSAM